MLLTDVLLLQRIKGVGNRTLRALIDFCHDNQLNNILDLASHNLSDVPKIKKVAKPLIDFFASVDYETSRRACESSLYEWKKAKIDVLVYRSSEYPPQLMSLEDPPSLLFCKGNRDLLKSTKAIAVVGTRKNTMLGEKITRKTVEHFSSQGFCIVSGLALGIDAIAHRAALENNGRTLAVLVDLVTITPSNHRDLAGQILKQDGLLVSENPPGTKVIPALFAKRDRIQAGLAMAVFAIETTIDGGTMHAVRAAISLGRDVYVPNANSARYPDLGITAISGTQALVNDGQATSYTRDSYKQITQALVQLAASFEVGSKETGNLR